jgi:hypothetical protein
MVIPLEKLIGETLGAEKLCKENSAACSSP